MKKIFLLLLVFLLTLANITSAFASYTDLRTLAMKASAEEPEVSCESAILINAETGEILYGKNIDEKLYPASITKLMTVLLALESDVVDDTIVFSRNAVFSIERNSNHIACDVDERLPVIDGLYAILLESANEVSNGIAELISGSMEDFALLMTKRAKELGCTNTNFTNANGLHDENHYTTAHDMALIAKELLKFDLFTEIATTATYEIAPTNIQSETRYMHMQNKMVLPSSNYYYEYCIGGKTGFTDQALNTLVTFAKKDGMTLICVVLKDNGAASTYNDSVSLFNYGFDNYETASLFTAQGYETTVKAENGEALTLKADSDFSVTLPKGSNVSSIQKIYTCPETVSSAKKGDAIGSIKFVYNDTDLGEVSLISQSTVSGSSSSADSGINILGILIKLLILLVVLFIAFLVYCYIKREIRYRKRKRLRQKRLQAIKAQNRTKK